MSVFVFAGPTLSADAARAELNAICLPPAAQGDVYRVTRYRPKAIGIIDGFFEHVPSIWHKEILWAMSQGIHVFGSASMGALRAAELTAFGMIGVGWIFEQYRDGALEDDDEVAVVHAPAESGYRTHSEAMVNIRRTLDRAETVGLLSGPTRQALERIGKAFFYPDRSYIAMLRRARAEGVAVAELDAFEMWLPQGRVDQKRDDALAMLSAIRTFLATEPGPKSVQYPFEYTNIWDRARREAGVLHLTDEPADALLVERVLDELRLDPEAYARGLQGAMVRYAALARADHGQPSRLDAQATDVSEIRDALGLDAATDVREWLTDNDLDRVDLERLTRDEDRLRLAGRIAEPEIAGHLADHLRLTGDYPRLRARARHKQSALQAAGWDNPSLAAIGLTEAELMAQFFEKRLGQPIPADCSAYAQRLGFPDRAAFVRTLLNEYCYLRLTEPST